MLNGKNHIAFAFLWVFILPVLYQPVHIVMHHSHRGHGHLNDTENLTQKNNTFQKYNHCYICEFEFTVNGMPEEFIVPFSAVFLGKLGPVKIENGFFAEIILQSSPRAPPFFS